MKLLVRKENGTSEVVIVSKEEFQEHWLERACNEAMELLVLDLVSVARMEVFKRYCHLAGMSCDEVFEIAANMIEIEKEEK